MVYNGGAVKHTHRTFHILLPSSARRVPPPPAGKHAFLWRMSQGRARQKMTKQALKAKGAG